MRSHSLFSILILLLLGMSGCTAAYNTRTVESADGKYSATCYVRGAVCRSYLSETKKIVRISIYELKPGAREFEEKERREAANAAVWVSDPSKFQRVKLLFENEWSIQGSDIEWEPIWREKGYFSIVFYDHGLRVPSSQNSAPKRILKTVSYKLDH